MKTGYDSLKAKQDDTKMHSIKLNKKYELLHEDRARLDAVKRRKFFLFPFDQLRHNAVNNAIHSKNSNRTLAN